MTTSKTSVFDAAHRAAVAAATVVLDERSLRSELERSGLKVLSLFENKDGATIEAKDKRSKRWTIVLAYDGTVSTQVLAGVEAKKDATIVRSRSSKKRAT